MRKHNRDDLIRLFFANKDKTAENQQNYCAPLPGSNQSDDSIVTVGLEFSQFSECNKEIKDFFDFSKTKNLSLSDVSFLTSSFLSPNRSDRTPQLFSTQKETRSPFASYRAEEPSTHRFQFWRALMFLCLVLTLGMITPSPLSGVEEVSGRHEERGDPSSVKKHSGPMERWNEAIEGFEIPFSYVFDE